MLRLFWVILLTLSATLCSFAQQVEQLAPHKLPKQTSYEGNLVDARRWQDNNGVNIIILSRTPTRNNNEWQSAYLYAYHYVKTDNKYRLLRKITDFVKDCEFDLILEHLYGSLVIADVDNNGLSEIIFMYQQTCTSDVSPVSVKLMLLENGDKYAIRGNNLIDLSSERYGGEKNIGQEFQQAAPAFLNFASAHWDSIITALTISDTNQQPYQPSYVVSGLDPQGDNFLSMRECGSTECREFDRLYNGCIVTSDPLRQQSRWIYVDWSTCKNKTGPGGGYVYGKYLIPVKQ